MFLRKNNNLLKYLFVVLMLPILFYVKVPIFAATEDELREQIYSITKTKQLLQEEIAGYEKQLKEIGEQATNLTNTIKSLNVSISKNALDIRLTQNNIDSTELQIEELGLGIDKDIKLIDLNLKTIASLLREVNVYDNVSLVKNFLIYKDFSEIWNDQQNLFTLQNQLREKITDTEKAKMVLESDKTDAEKKKEELIKLKTDLLDRKNLLDITKKEKNKLLSETKNSEENYKNILSEKKLLADAFDKELAQFESDLKFVIDPNSYPSPGKGIFSWPLDIIKLTQLFGKTEFGKRVYANGFHNGVDFKAPFGTEVKATLSGIIRGVGDTDTTCPGASFGKWILLEHNNGLSTTFAHLSLIKVSAGQFVMTGDVIGYSGNTGFSTGPHLHISVYPTQGVKISTLKSAVPTCAGRIYTMPISNSYLDPLIYF